MYSGAGANYSTLGFCCDADLCASCGGPTCAAEGVKVEYKPDGRPERRCCKTWLAQRRGRIRPCDASGAVPCFFDPRDPRPVRDEEVAAHAARESEADKEKLWQPRAAAPAYERCAVVASSPQFATARLGAEIDGYDAIIRFNMAPTAGYEQHVGSRTTVMLLNDVIARDVALWGGRCGDWERVQLLYGFMYDDWREIGEEVRAEMRSRSPACDHAELVDLKPWRERYQLPYASVCQRWANLHSVPNIRCRRPSMGTCGILMATIGGTCRHTTLYGWGDPLARARDGHYWDLQHEHSKGAHSYNIEAATAIYIAEMVNMTSKGQRTVTLRPVKDDAVVA